MLSNFVAPKFDSATTRVLRKLPTGWRRGTDFARRALPQACMLCTTPSGDALLCAACWLDMPRTEVACPRCALPSARVEGASDGGGKSAAGLTCGACLARPPPFALT